MTTKIFDTNRDSQLIASGTHFGCMACLVAKPLDNQSRDPRYCQGCCDFLLKEAAMISSGKRPQWIPRVPPKLYHKALQSKSGVGHNYTNTPMGSPMGSGIMATVGSPKIKVTKRGPKHRADLPVELITQWGGEGMNSKAITARLKAELNITIGFRTVARILAGQRVLIFGEREEEDDKRGENNTGGDHGRSQNKRP